jgi:hypothetical protein
MASCPDCQMAGTGNRYRRFVRIYKEMYGVAEYTPIIIRTGDQIVNTFIMDLARRCSNETWVTCDEQPDKEYCELQDVETWTEEGWTTIHRVIRHKKNYTTTLVRVVTDNGIVDVTDGHSVLTQTELLHCPLPKDEDNDVETFHEVRKEMLSYYENNKWKISTSPTKETIITNTPTHYDEIIDPNIHPFMLSLNLYKKLKEDTIHRNQNITIRIDATAFKSPFFMALVYQEFSMFDMMLKTSYSKYRDEYVLTYSPEDKGFDNKIKFREEIPYQGFRRDAVGSLLPDASVGMRDLDGEVSSRLEYVIVYDLVTENRHFAAGVGNIIVEQSYTNLGIEDL